ncbi:MAG: hypothetical protein KatS3mg110_4175 [Pirellulaceae bacterium]|nr:MAG: hypothetical protein KatS3mg110_4175 [Pirellulaceae bacterium]
MGAFAAKNQVQGWTADVAAAIQLARSILRQEGQAVLGLAERLSDDSLQQAVELIYGCRGKLVVCGIGKAGLIARKWVATFSSTGTPSQFLHPAEALHGDLGCVRTDDVVAVLSLSGETEEILRLVSCLVRMSVALLAVTARATSTLGQSAHIVVELGPVQEACPLGLAPTTSTTLMAALGDALALAVSHRRGFTERDFLRYHPGGSLGRRLTCVDELMRPLPECRVASDSCTVRQVFTAHDRPGRRTGAVMLVDEKGRLSGIFTDSDLARLIASAQDVALDRPIFHVMTRSPIVVPSGRPVQLALQLLQEHKISELPVVDSEGRPVGIIDITDILGLPQTTGPLKIHRPQVHCEENAGNG